MQGLPMRFRGIYSPSVIYAAGDVVSFNGSTYVGMATETVPGIQPDQNQSMWFVLFQKAS